jgi:cell division protein FtsA
VNLRTSLLAGRQPKDVIGLLDIGTAKTVCVIISLPRLALARRSLADVRVLGVGMAPTRGLSEALVVGLDEAEQAVRVAVAQAERAAGLTLDDVLVAVACGELRSSRLAANTRINGRVVGKADMVRMMRGARTYAERDGRALLHIACHSYRLDGAAGIADPRGLAGAELGADLNAVTTDEAPLRNLLHVIERAYLTPALIAPAPLASALAATSSQERQQGVIAADIGAGATKFALFAAGQLVENGVIPLGGNHITFALARELGAPPFEAERIKKECGTLNAAAADECETLAYVRAISDAPAPCETTRGQVRTIVRERMGELFARIGAALVQSASGGARASCAVLSGGASQQAGLDGLAAGLLGLPVRLAEAAPLPGMPSTFGGPAFSTAIGLAHIALDPNVGMEGGRIGRSAQGYLKRMGQWLQESF